MKDDDLWSGEERRGIPRRPVTDIATLAVAVGYLRRSIDVLSTNIEAKLRQRTIIFRVVTLALIVATALNTVAILYIRSLESEKAEILAEAVVVSCEQSHKLEEAIQLMLQDLAAPRDVDAPGEAEERQRLLNQIAQRLDTTECDQLVESLPMVTPPTVE